MKVRVSNIGGITRELTISVEKGLTLYKAPNAYGKTSLTKALVSLLTSSITAADLLNVFSDEGYVEVELDNKLYYRRFHRIKNKIEEEKNLIMDDDRALLLSYFSPENQLLARIITGDENVEWFISKTSKVQELKAKKEELERKLTELKTRQEELTKKYQEIKDISRELERINEEIDRLERERKNLQKNAAQTIILTRQNRLTELKSRVETRQKELRDNQARLEKLDKEIEELKQKADQTLKEKIRSELTELDKKLQELSSKKNSIDIEIGVLNRVLDEIKESEKEHASVCHVCGSKVDPSIWKTRMDIISKELENANRSKNELLTELNSTIARKNELEAKIKEIEKAEKMLAEKQIQRENLAIKIETIKHQIAEYERQIKELEEKINEINEIYSMGEGESEIDKKLEELKKKRGDLEYQLQTLGVSSKILEEITTVQNQIEEITKQIDDLQREYIRRLTVIRERFTEMATSLLKELEFDFTAEIDNNYRLIVKRMGAQLEIRKLSSSERTTLALILVLVALKEYFKTPYFIVDESFMTFDQKRFEKLVKYLNGVVDYIIITKSDEMVQLTNEIIPATMAHQVVS
ncbi:archaea-specific SMC-related protein [Sulfurisphaera ohwakuensis]|uniref:archaea-specific SMC-related protein n=1 Tax=Sulfurisphaera ohwakuensis TaxID=69656 RepID=UPI0036F30707